MKLLRSLPSKLQDLIVIALRWLRRRLPLILGLALWIVIVGVFIVPFLYSLQGFGFGTFTDAAGVIVPQKTFWDWMELFIAPAFLALGALWINSTIQRIERERAEKREEVDRKIADDRLKEQALQTYLDRIGEMLLSGKFDDPDARENAKTVARARTLTVLRGLDSGRKSALIRFLSEAGLISGNQAPAIDLSTADLQDTDLSRIQLSQVKLHRANLQKSNLRMSNLAGAFLPKAHLQETNLSWANLQQAHLDHANLENANLERAQLQNAYLVGTNLKGANLSGTNLERADLFGAKVTQEQLAQAIIDTHTLLPNGEHPKLPPEPPQ